MPLASLKNLLASVFTDCETCFLHIYCYMSLLRVFGNVNLKLICISISFNSSLSFSSHEFKNKQNPGKDAEI